MAGAAALVCQKNVLKKTNTMELVGVHTMAHTLAWQKEIPVVYQKKAPKKTKAVGLLQVHMLAYPLALWKDILKGSS